MRHLLSRQETYRFTCRGCRHEWDRDYQVSHWMDPEGDERVVFTIDGVVTCPPWSGEACGDYRVDVVLHAARSGRQPDDEPEWSRRGRAARH
jgi:hypothetical protein